MRSFDVAIVGCGPVGATLANLLGARGVRTLVIEREAEVYRLPRAIHFDGECMRVFQAAGIADELAPELVVSPGMKFIDADGRLLIDWNRPTRVGPQGWHPSYRFHQPALEARLRRRMEAFAHVELRRMHQAVSIEAGDDDVVMQVEDRTHGTIGEIRARYVVGCDGARSIVRRTMGSDLVDLDSHERWLVVDVILKRERPDLGDHSIQFCDPARPATYVRGVGMRRRWEFMLFATEDADEMSRPERIWSLLSRWVTPDEAVLERPAVYTFHAVVAEGWRNGRLMIAGDAAHQTPPFMGQGMCAGIRDASNLSWKLAAVVQGRADEALLDTYESERAPHVREFITTAVRLGRVIQTSDPVAARERNRRMAERPEVFSTPQPRLGPGAHDDCAPAGMIGEQGRCANGARLDDVAGDDAVLLVGADMRPSIAPHDGVKVVVADSPSLSDWLRRLDACAVLIRPDRYVAGVARGPQEIAPVVRRWVDKHFGAMPSASLQTP